MQAAPPGRRQHSGLLIPVALSGWHSFANISWPSCTWMTPAMVADPLREASRWLTVGAMATLGLSVDTRVVAKVGRPVITTVLASLVILIAVSAGLIRLLGI